MDRRGDEREPDFAVRVPVLMEHEHRGSIDRVGISEVAVVVADDVRGLVDDGGGVLVANE